jgi:hypothetical protein
MKLNKKKTLIEKKIKEKKGRAKHYIIVLCEEGYSKTPSSFIL